VTSALAGQLGTILAQWTLVLTNCFWMMKLVRLSVSVLRKAWATAGGAKNVEIEWVPVGTRFVIGEYDGSESLMTIDDFGWMEA
jgi:hypothetical protein